MYDACHEEILMRLLAIFVLAIFALAMALL